MKVDSDWKLAVEREIRLTNRCSCPLRGRLEGFMQYGNSKKRRIDAAGQLNSMLDGFSVLSKHIVYTILSTSLTLFRATLSTRGERDALEEEVSDGREGKLYP